MLQNTNKIFDRSLRLLLYVYLNNDSTNINNNNDDNNNNNNNNNHNNNNINNMKTLPSLCSP